MKIVNVVINVVEFLVDESVFMSINWPPSEGARRAKENKNESLHCVGLQGRVVNPSRNPNISHAPVLDVSPN